jgi:hypothetical protein
VRGFIADDCGGGQGWEAAVRWCDEVTGGGQGWRRMLWKIMRLASLNGPVLIIFRMNTLQDAPTDACYFSFLGIGFHVSIPFAPADLSFQILAMRISHESVQLDPEKTDLSIAHQSNLN